ncbi:MAG: hypothetical protein LCH96_18695 [Actinobacteria bacterium]|nr:hypothetical protein [Actinomycetota bacterium]
MSGWRRIVVALGLAASGVLLTGCHVEGTAELIEEDRVSFDLILTGDAYCPLKGERTYLGRWSTNGIVGEFVTTANGEEACHLTGRMPLSDLAFVTGGTTTDVAEYTVQELTFEHDHSEWPDGGITLRLPGEVLSSNQGVVDGNTIRFDSLSSVDNHLTIVMLSRPGPPNAVIWLIAGGVGGVVLALLGVGLVRVVRRGRAVPTPSQGMAEPDGPEPAEPELPPSDPEPQPPPSDPEPLTPDTEPPPLDHSVWAPPAGPRT